MNILYCLPVIKQKQAEVVIMLEKAPNYQYYEIWLDYIIDLDHDFIVRLIEKYSGRLIFVFRRKNLEKPQRDLGSRLSLLSLLERTESYVDLDITTQQEELKFIGEHMLQIPLIASYHNYKETPVDLKLIEIIVEMMRYNPRIFKIATMCQSPKDALRLLDILISLKKEQKKYIILGMGEYGSITRVYGSLWGNEMIFTPIDKQDASSPGQLTKHETETILSILIEKH